MPDPRPCGYPFPPCPPQPAKDAQDNALTVIDWYDALSPEHQEHVKREWRKKPDLPEGPNEKF